MYIFSKGNSNLLSVIMQVSYIDYYLCSFTLEWTTSKCRRGVRVRLFEEELSENENLEFELSTEADSIQIDLCRTKNNDEDCLTIGKKTYQVQFDT